MPHSSGGGSHGGGSHSSHRSGRSGSRSGGTVHRIRKSHFSGARRFAYYKNNNIEYVYANYDMTRKPSKMRFLLLLFYLPFFVAIFIMLSNAYIVPAKVKVDYDTNIVIQDRADFLESFEETELEKTFEKFFEETGIMPALITDNNCAWMGSYSSLEQYAYDLYVNYFDDEKHWLIVYTGQMDTEGYFDNWYWEGMQGDDTDEIISEAVADEFTEKLQKYCLQTKNFRVGRAVNKAFLETTDTIMKPRFNIVMLIMGLLFGVFVVFHACAMLGFNPKTIKYRNVVECKSEAIEYRCTYCGGIYLLGTCISCPHCGAPVVSQEDYLKDVLGEQGEMK